MNSMLTGCLICLLQVTSKGSLVERHAKGTGMMSGWGSVWRDKTNPMEKFWYVFSEREILKGFYDGSKTISVHFNLYCS